ncbi:hypothetical protein [Lysobacter gummosus]|uniref:hypothetical protein n=1 Tax=Lysobacter gummosus TaxID=262324 RepID=UPI00363B0AF9
MKRIAGAISVVLALGCTREPPAAQEKWRKRRQPIPRLPSLQRLRRIRRRAAGPR